MEYTIVKNEIQQFTFRFTFQQFENTNEKQAF